MARSCIYRTLLDKLERRIAGLKEGVLLPAEQELADEFQVSKPTLRRALSELAERGCIAKINGVGSAVRSRPRTIPRELLFLCRDLGFFAETLDSFGKTAEAAGYFAAAVPLS